MLETLAAINQLPFAYGQHTSHENGDDMGMVYYSVYHMNSPLPWEWIGVAMSYIRLEAKPKFHARFFFPQTYAL